MIACRLKKTRQVEEDLFDIILGTEPHTVSSCCLHLEETRQIFYDIILGTELCSGSSCRLHLEDTRQIDFYDIILGTEPHLEAAVAYILNGHGKQMILRYNTEVRASFRKQLSPTSRNNTANR